MAPKSWLSGGRPVNKCAPREPFRDASCATSGLIGWWNWSEEFRQGREVKISIQPDEMNIPCDFIGFFNLQALF